MLSHILTFIASSVLTFIFVCCLFLNSNSFSIGDKIIFKATNTNFEFVAIPSKGRNISMMEKAFNKYKNEHDITDIECHIYRVTKKNYFKISKWSQYKNLPEWNYPLGQ